MSYNRNIMMIIGARSIGKTYAVKKRCISEFIKNKHQFVYLRRFESELDDVRTVFDDVIKNEFEDITFSITGNVIYINNEIAGFVMALSKAQTYKSKAYTDVRNILFDEFLIEAGTFRNYLKNEVKDFLSLFSTIDRDRDLVKAFLLANAVSVDNPYFIAMRIAYKDGMNFIRPVSNVIIEIVKDEYEGNNRNSKFSKMVREMDSDYAEYAYNNKFTQDSYSLIEPVDLSNYTCILIIKSTTGDNIGIWTDYNGKLHCSHKYDPNCKYKFTRYNKYSDTEFNICKSITQYPLNIIRQHYYKSLISFSSLHIKYEIIRYVDKYDHI